MNKTIPKFLQKQFIIILICYHGVILNKQIDILIQTMMKLPCRF